MVSTHLYYMSGQVKTVAISFFQEGVFEFIAHVQAGLANWFIKKEPARAINGTEELTYEIIKFYEKCKCFKQKSIGGPLVPNVG